MLDPKIFKANDIRGVVVGDAPEWDLDGARALGAAFVALTGADEFVLGRDMRALGRELSLAECVPQDAHTTERFDAEGLNRLVR